MKTKVKSLKELFNWNQNMIDDLNRNSITLIDHIFLIDNKIIYFTDIEGNILYQYYEEDNKLKVFVSERVWKHLPTNEIKPFIILISNFLGTKHIDLLGIIDDEEKLYLNNVKKYIKSYIEEMQIVNDRYDTIYNYIISKNKY